VVQDHPSKHSRRCLTKHRASLPSADAERLGAVWRSLVTLKEVDEVASPNPNDVCGRKPCRIKGGLVKSELAVRASQPTGEQLRQV
jgi:hypothetical protein